MSEKHTRFCHRLIGLSLEILLCVLLITSNQTLVAQTALPLLSGFDEQRLQATYPIRDESGTSEAAKLLYRLRRIDRSILASLEAAVPPVPGDPFEIDGEIVEIRRSPIPQRLVETLELQQLQEIVVVTNGRRSLRVVTTELPSGVVEGDRVSGIGVLVMNVEESDDAVVAAVRLSWFPRAAPNAGVTMLTEKGIDAASILDLETRDRLSLMPEDADVFYPVLRAADEIANSADKDIEPPQQVDPVALLRDPRQFTGQWLRMSLNSVRVTRIAVTDDRRRRQLGGDHYFQIDASGELDNVVISIARPSGDPGEPIQFDSSYPVSLAVKQLPKFLSDAIAEQEGGGAVSTMITKSISVDGFFLRLWSYENDFMQRRGGGKQFGPLLIASRIYDLEPTTSDPVGVRFIGWLAAAGVLFSIIGVAIWSRLTGSRDKEVVRHRKNREAEQLKLPDEPPT